MWPVDDCKKEVTDVMNKKVAAHNGVTTESLPKKSEIPPKQVEILSTKTEILPKQAEILSKKTEIHPILAILGGTVLVGVFLAFFAFSIFLGAAAFVAALGVAIFRTVFETEILPKKAEILPKNTEILPKNTEILSKKSEILPKKAEAKTNKDTRQRVVRGGRRKKKRKEKQAWQAHICLMIIRRS